MTFAHAVTKARIQEDHVDKHEYLFSSESVTEGHPDKIADQISDAILDAALTDDPYSRVACETLTTTGLVLVSGEISTQTYIDIPRVVRDVVRDVGYSHSSFGFDDETCSVITTIHEQSPDIAQGVGRPTRCAPTSTTTTHSTARAPATRA